MKAQLKACALAVPTRSRRAEDRIDRPPETKTAAATITIASINTKEGRPRTSADGGDRQSNRAPGKETVTGERSAWSERSRRGSTAVRSKRGRVPFSRSSAMAGPTSVTASGMRNTISMVITAMKTAPPSARSGRGW